MKAYREYSFASPPPSCPKAYCTMWICYQWLTSNVDFRKQAYGGLQPLPPPPLAYPLYTFINVDNFERHLIERLPSPVSVTMCLRCRLVTGSRCSCRLTTRSRGAAGIATRTRTTWDTRSTSTSWCSMTHIYWVSHPSPWTPAVSTPFRPT